MSDDLYPYRVFENWGTDAAAETTAEVWLHLLTPLDSIPFFREFGSLLPAAENAPGDFRTLIAAELSAVNSLAQYSQVAAVSRRALTDYDSIAIGFQSESEGDGNFDLTVIRLADKKSIPISA